MKLLTSIVTHNVLVEHNGKLYIPVKQATPERGIYSNNDLMHLDDTKDKVYVYNLDDEISDIESEEKKLVFLPDIEKGLSKIPKHVLTSHNPPHMNNELILYAVPESLSVPREQDNVRKAIIETRERAREKQFKESTANEALHDTALESRNGVHEYSSARRNEVVVTGNDEDEDAMDIG